MALMIFMGLPITFKSISVLTAANWQGRSFCGLVPKVSKSCHKNVGACITTIAMLEKY